MIKCGKCGNELIKTDVMCSSCHTSILELKQTNNIIFESTPKVEEDVVVIKKNNFSKYFIMLLGIIILIVGCYYLTTTFILKDKNVKELIDSGYVAGKVTEREILSYLKYKTPESWTRNASLDETYMREVDYFDYKDKKSTIFFKVISPAELDPITNEYKTGVDKEQWINNIKHTIDSTDVKALDETYDGVVWTKIYGNTVDLLQNNFINSTFMHISLDNNDLYIIEVKQYISSNEKDNNELSKSIKYILENAKPQK